MKVGPYEVLGELGRGGMGVVYRVRAPSGGEAALKLLARVDANALARFERERRLLASLGEEEGFVGLLDAGATHDTAWLVMPLVPGGTLRQKLERGPLGVEETISLGIDLATALGRAHEKGIVHRDVKPENVLFAAPGRPGSGPPRPLLADLGLAKHFDPLAKGASQSVQLTREGILTGTAGYMAPEQIANAASVGPAADVFALGAVLHECLAGRPAFEGDNLIEVMTKLTSGTVAPLERASVPRWLEAVLARSLATDARVRFPDGASFARALRGGAGPVPGAPGRGSGSRAAFRILVASASCVLVALGVAVTLLAGPPRAGASRPEPPVPTHAAPATASPTPLGAPDPPLADTAGSVAALSSRHVLRARQKMGRKDYEGALADLSRALELEPALATTWAARGEVKAHLGDLRGAIADYGEAIARDEKLASAWRGRGTARGGIGDLKGAESDLGRTIELDGRRGLDYQNRGLARVKLDDTAGAIADETRAIELDPALESAWFLRGVLRGNTGDNEGAIADLTRSLELEPGSLEALTHRAKAYVDKGDAARALRDVEAASAVEPKDARLPALRRAIEALEKKR